jgi:hypothetical protein
MANNRIEVWAPPTIGGSKDIWGPWYKSDTVVFTTPGATSSVTLDFSTLSDAPSAFNVELRYYHKGKLVTRSEPIAGDGSVTFEVGGDVNGDAVQPYFRLQSLSVGQIVTVDPGNFSFLPGKPPESNTFAPKAPAPWEGGALSNIDVSKISYRNGFDFWLENDDYDYDRYSLLGNNAFANSFTSLGYSSSLLNDFELDGWGGLGYQNGFFDDYTFDFGGSNYTIFGEDDTLTFGGDYFFDLGFWGTDFSFANALDSYSFLDTFSTYQNHISPLAFDLDNDGIESTGIYDTRVYFDIDGDQFAEKVGWIAPDDGLLALDVNGDGVINDITELFGDDIMPAFDKLARHDSNGDGAITAADADYARLKVWRDFDQDGFSDANELFVLSCIANDNRPGCLPGRCMAA